MVCLYHVSWKEAFESALALPEEKRRHALRLLERQAVKRVADAATVEWPALLMSWERDLERVRNELVATLHA